MASLRYTHALVSRVSSSYKSLGEADYEEAKRQHETYVRVLRDTGLDVIELPPDDALPQCVFIEDTAIVCNGIALMGRPKDDKRLKEVNFKLQNKTKISFVVFFVLCACSTKKNAKYTQKNKTNYL